MRLENQYYWWLIVDGVEVKALTLFGVMKITMRHWKI